MIRIEWSESELFAAIDEVDPTWRARAVALTRKVVRAKRVVAADAIWSRVKSVYIQAQAYRCIYCERPMAKIEPGATAKVGVEYDVEHYRPKNAVKPWPTAREIGRRPEMNAYARRVRAGHRRGYVRLAFEPTNYAVSCKLCNSGQKANYFPIAGKAKTTGRDRASLDRDERPLVWMPFGRYAPDPATVLLFVGAAVQPRAKRGHAYLVGRVTIDFFELDVRADLVRGRAMVVALLWPRLCRGRGASAFLANNAFRGCARDFVALFARDRAAAERSYRAAEAYLESADPGL
jgi:hypothetical protein